MHYLLNKTCFPLLPAISPGLAASSLARSTRFSLLIPISKLPHLSLNPLHSPMALYEHLPRHYLAECHPSTIRVNIHRRQPPFRYVFISFPERLLPDSPDHRFIRTLHSFESYTSFFLGPRGTAIRGTSTRLSSDTTLL